MREPQIAVESAAELQTLGPASTSVAWSNTNSVLQKIFSFPAMLGVFLVGRVFYEARAFVVDPDLWWHIRIGQDILATHQWPTVDPYSLMSG